MAEGGTGRSSRRAEVLLPFLSVLIDAAAIESAFLLSYVLRSRTGLFERFGFVYEAAPPFERYFVTSLVVVVAWILLFQARQMYRTRRNVMLSEELLNIVRVVTFGMLLLMSAAFLYRDFSYSRLFVALLWILSIVFLFLGRAGINSYERHLYRMRRHLQRAVILGATASAGDIYRKLHRHASFGFEILGYFSQQRAADGALLNSPWLGTLPAAPAYLLDNGINLAFIALPADQQGDLLDVVHACEGVDIEFMMVPDMVEMLTTQVRTNELEGIPFLKLKGIALTAWGRISKRAFDLAVSLLSLLLFAPLWIVIAMAVKLTSRGPVLFTQRRVGLDGRSFTMYKFRSMRPGAEEQTGPVWVREHDPRRTAVGVFLRKTSLDEFPQLLNVLKGEMSLVGPRPERPFFVEKFKHLVPQYLDRHRVKTGMTGWAQVNGLRGGTSLEERIRYDLYYIENWSFAFDIRILLRTLHAAIKVKEVH
jgi:exopolysaccharide biosynthesis polyprenyl glycosylphosphotransferase